MNFDTERWLYYLHHNQKQIADAMRRAHNRAIITLAINPRQRLRNWDITFEQKGIDTHATRIAGDIVLIENNSSPGENVLAQNNDEQRVGC